MNHSSFLVEQVARIIYYYVEPDPILIKLDIDDKWISFTEEQKGEWKARAVTWLNELATNYPTAYSELQGGIIPPHEKFW